MVSLVKVFCSPAIKSSTLDWLKGHDSTFSTHVGSPNYPVIAARTALIFAASIGLLQYRFKMPLAIFNAVWLSGGWIAGEYWYFIQAVRKAALEIYAMQAPVPSSTWQGSIN